MSDLLNHFLPELMEFFSILITGCCLKYFLDSFLESRWVRNKRNKLFFLMLYTVLRYIRSGILPPTSNYENMNYESLRILSGVTLSACIIVLMTVCFYKMDKVVFRMSVFLTVTFLAVSEISLLCASLLSQLELHLINFFSWCLEKEYLSIDSFLNLVYLSNTVTTLFLYAGSIFLLYMTLKKIVHNFREKDYSIHKTELLFLLLPDLTGLLFCILLRIIMVTMEDSMPVWIYEKYPVFRLVVPVILILFLLSIVYGVKLFQNMICFNRERSGRIILEKQISGMQTQMEEMEHIYAGLRSMKHDMKNTLSVIMRLAAIETEGNKAQTGGQAESGIDNPSGQEENANDNSFVQEKTELEAYLAELNRTFDRLDFPYKTGNTVVDTILNMKQHEIVRSMPDMLIESDRLIFPAKLFIRSYDIGVIVGNALDNAIEACAKLRKKDADAAVFIRLSSFFKGQMFFLEIENSFDGLIIRQKGNEFPMTNKTNQEMHGIGLTGIKNAAEKYHGAVDWTVSGSVFTLSVMMRNERSMEE